MFKNIKNRLIKLLGGYTKNECILKENELLNADFIEMDNIKKAHLRAIGVGIVIKDNLPSIIINIKKDFGLELLKSNDFLDSCSNLLEKTSENENK